MSSLQGSENDPSATRPDHPPPLDQTATRSKFLLETTPQSGGGLRIQTDMISQPIGTVVSKEPSSRGSAGGDGQHLTTTSINIGLARTPSIKNIIASSAGAGSNFGGSAPNSALSSPMLSALADVTPLPSPLMSNDSPGPWRKLARIKSHDKPLHNHNTPDAALVTANGESISAAIANHTKRRAYHGLSAAVQESGLTSPQVNKEKMTEGHGRNRSVSEYVPEPIQVPKIRNITVSGSHAQILDVAPILEVPTSTETTMRREPHLAVQRGIAPIPSPPTPPRSRTGAESSDSDSSLSHTIPARAHKKARHEYFEANMRIGAKRKRWRAVRVLGQGTFSKVVLATSQLEEDDRVAEDDVFQDTPMGGVLSPIEPEPYSRSQLQELVAVKICEHGPKGGASEERVEMSLKRELEIMKSIHHPSLVHLKAWSIEETRAILVLGYCPGGDLFDLASQRKDLLVPGLLRRIFAEIVGAVRYLHERHIVHRDIKLENILVNLPSQELAQPRDWSTYPYSLTTLTDLGLSRRVADDERLTTRCGSDDYAAPEVIMGQPYDGRATDAWSLGVLLYALLESRLPFDPNPGMSEGHKQRSRTSHRIARVDWSWVEYVGEEGDHESDPEKFRAKGLEGAMRVTEGLLRRSRNRWTLEQVVAEEWVGKGVDVESGIRFTPEEEENEP